MQVYLGKTAPKASLCSLRGILANLTSILFFIGVQNDWPVDTIPWTDGKTSPSTCGRGNLLPKVFISRLATRWRTVPGPALSGVQTTDVFRLLSMDDNEVPNFGIKNVNLNRDKRAVCVRINPTDMRSINCVSLTTDAQILSPAQTSSLSQTRDQAIA